MPSIWLMLPSPASPATAGDAGDADDILFMAAVRVSGVDGLTVLAVAGDGDLAGLGLLGDRDVQAEHARVVAGRDVLGVQVVAQNQLTAEHTARAFGGQRLPTVVTRRAFGPDGHHVAFHVQVDRDDADAG